jgi:hypothetical protein
MFDRSSPQKEALQREEQQLITAIDGLEELQENVGNHPELVAKIFKTRRRLREIYGLLITTDFEKM